PSIAMRLELKQGINNSTLINDTYNSDLTSLSIALNFLSQQSQHKKHTVVLSDLQQVGLPEVELYKEVARMLKQSDIHQFVGVGENMVKYRSEFDILENVAVHFFKSTDDLLGYVRNYQAQNEAILLK